MLLVEELFLMPAVITAITIHTLRRISVWYCHWICECRLFRYRIEGTLWRLFPTDFREFFFLSIIFIKYSELYRLYVRTLSLLYSNFLFVFFFLFTCDETLVYLLLLISLVFFHTKIFLSSFFSLQLNKSHIGYI